MAGRYLCQRVRLGCSRLLSTGLGSGRERVFVVGVGMTKFQKVRRVCDSQPSDYLCVVHLATGCRGTQLPTDGKRSSYQGTGGCRRAL